MRRLVIFAVFILGLPPIGFAQTANQGWIADGQTGCRVWIVAPQPNGTVSWSGDCKDGMAQGPGILRWFKDGKPDGAREGNANEGQLIGHVVATDANGNRYDGDWRENKPNGHGIVTYVSGDRYDGEWHDGKPNGHGVIVYVNGNRFEGDWRDGQPDGHGVVTYANGARYVGELRDGKRNGHGVMTYGSGALYDGEWHDNKASGVGKYTAANGDSVDGFWTTGCFRDGNRRLAVGVDLSSCP